MPYGSSSWRSNAKSGLLPFLGLVFCERTSLQRRPFPWVWLISSFSACVASIIRLIYTIRLTKTTDSSYVIGQVAMWAIAEFSTVSLAGTFPTLPRLIQWFMGHKNHPNSYPQPHSYPSRTNRSDIEAGTPWRGHKGTETTDSYIPLDDKVVPSNWRTGPEERHVDDGLAFAPSAQRNEVLKTVRIETKYGPSEDGQARAF